MQKIIIISSPSGCGKDTVLRKLLNFFNNSRKVITSTTRNARTNEIDGIHYHFLNKEAFIKMIENDEFLEWQDVFGELYGISKKEFRNNAEYSFIILDVLGALRIKHLIPYDSVLIFLKPPSKEILEDRLKKRGTENKDEISRRLERYEMEINMSKLFDYIVINDELEKTIDDIIDIIK